MSAFLFPKPPGSRQSTSHNLILLRDLVKFQPGYYIYDYAVALETRPDYVQLHYRKTLADTAFIVDNLRKYNIKIIKSLFPDSADLEKTARQFESAGVYALLLDPRTPDNAVDGGVADFAFYIKIKHAVKCPVILAGGINHDNVKEAVRQTGAPIIDLTRIPKLNNSHLIYGAPPEMRC